MKKFLIISSLFVCTSYAEQKVDYNRLKIELNPKIETEWRSSTIYKVVKFCIELGEDEAKCNCMTDLNRKKYKENDFLKIRQNILNKMEKNQDLNQDKDIIEFITNSQLCTEKND